MSMISGQYSCYKERSDSLCNIKEGGENEASKICIELVDHARRRNRLGAERQGPDTVVGPILDEGHHPRRQGDRDRPLAYHQPKDASGIQEPRRLGQGRPDPGVPWPLRSFGGCTGAGKEKQRARIRTGWPESGVDYARRLASRALAALR